MDKAIPWIASVAGAAVAGLIQIKQDQLLPTVAFLLLAGLALGAMWPHGSWRWGLILGLGIPIAYLAAPWLGVAVIESSRPHILVSFFSILPALAGTSSGVALRVTSSGGISRNP